MEHPWGRLQCWGTGGSWGERGPCSARAAGETSLGGWKFEGGRSGVTNPVTSHSLSVMSHSPPVMSQPTLISQFALGFHSPLCDATACSAMSHSHPGISQPTLLCHTAALGCPSLLSDVIQLLCDVTQSPLGCRSCSMTSHNPLCGVRAHSVTSHNPFYAITQPLSDITPALCLYPTQPQRRLFDTAPSGTTHSPSLTSQPPLWNVSVIR